MALLMEPGSEPQTVDEIADLQAINALKESAALEFKEEGNQYVKKGKKHYSDAINCYTKAINQKALSDSENSVIFANRAHVNLLLGNYRRALTDAEEAIRLCPTNIKALYRAVKASLALNLLSEAKQYCQEGLQKDPDNEELRKLARQVDLRKSEIECHEAQVSKDVAEAKGIISALEYRKLNFGKACYRELTGLRKPTLDKDNILHWPVLFLYAEVMTSDIIEDFCETDMFSVHLDVMFSEDCPPLTWDTENAYTREAIELYYEAGSGVCLSEKEVLHYFLEGTSASSQVEKFVEEEKKEHNNLGSGTSAGHGPRWIKVNEKRSLYDVLKEPNLTIPGVPVFYVVSKRSSFYKDFKAGKWAPPQ